jgi:hypothetical protein
MQDLAREHTQELYLGSYDSLLATDGSYWQRYSSIRDELGEELYCVADWRDEPQYADRYRCPA